MELSVDEQDLTIFINLINQVANAFNLVGNYYMAAAAVIQAQPQPSEFITDLANYYNVIGNQLAFLSAVLYYWVGELAYEQGLLPSTDGDQSEASSQQDDSSPSNQEYSRVWRIKRTKRLRRRRWRMIQHYGNSLPTS